MNCIRSRLFGSQARVTKTSRSSASISSSVTSREAPPLPPQSTVASLPAMKASCAVAWPPQTASGTVKSPYTTIKRSDGTTQLVFDGHPLYTYIADTTPGTASGNNVNAFGGVWREVPVSGSAAPASSTPAASTPAASIPSAASSAPASSSASAGSGSSSGAAQATAVGLKTASIGGVTVLTNAKGFALYSFAPDTATKSACTGACAAAWPPQPASGTVKSPYTTITRSDGSTQLVFDGHPLYTYIADTSPGTASGNGVNAFGGVWKEVPASGSAAPAASASPASQGGVGY